jgi:hypothetical protein
LPLNEVEAFALFEPSVITSAGKRHDLSHQECMFSFLKHAFTIHQITPAPVGKRLCIASRRSLSD